MSTSRFQEQFFENTAYKSPELIAVDDHGITITYSELNDIANMAANLLVDLGVVPNDRICILANKGIDAYAAVLGILKSGACWVPMPPRSPEQWLLTISSSVEPKAIICDLSNLESAIKIRSQLSKKPIIISFNDSHHSNVYTVKDLPKSKPRIEPRNVNDMAYIIYTSGSTGTPKGVVVSHKNTCKFLESCNTYFNFTEGLRFAHFSELSFDPSIFDLFFSWSKSGTVVPFNKKIYRINPSLYFKECTINVLFTVPSVIHKLLEIESNRSNELASVKFLLLTGEKYLADLVATWQKLYPHSTVYNMYGTTETAIVSHWYKFPKNFTKDMPVPVGIPLPGFKIYLRDDDGCLRSHGIGECVASGDQISVGYWNNEFETSRSFLSSSEGDDVTIESLYRLGDVLRTDSTGIYYYVGRLDTQVKILGHRIELGAVEDVLLKYPFVTEAVVVPLSIREGATMNELLAAHLVCQTFLNEDSIRNYLHKTLPLYMVPKFILITQDALPRNYNGKINRKLIQSILQEQFLQP